MTVFAKLSGFTHLIVSSLQAHKNCQNMTEIEAKVSYVKLARSLKTYGVSFFLVKVRTPQRLTSHINVSQEAVNVMFRSRYGLYRWSFKHLGPHL